MSKNTSWQTSLIWFGAAISVAEIEAGRAIGANGFALLLGHLLGGVVLFAAALIGARMRQGAMETTSSAFGSKGARFFAFLNVVQLIGWIAVMNEQTTKALAEQYAWFNSPITHFVLSALVGLWVIVGILKTTKLATFAMGALALLMAFLTFKLLGNASFPEATSETMPFWTAFELSAAMPLSWAPVIADYTRTAERPILQSSLSALVYTLASIWMYLIGMFLGSESLPAALVVHKLSLVGIPVLIVSTVTTNLLAAHSAGESSRVVSKRLNFKAMVAVSVLAAAALSVFNIEHLYINFLLFIASVFAPMAAVLITQHFFVKRTCVGWNLFAWAVGFSAYHVAVHYDTAPTVVSLTLSVILAFLPRFFR